MGLDNGIIMKGSFPADDCLEEIPSAILKDMGYNFHNSTHPETFELDLAYWRKYWGIRRDIFDIISKNGGYTADNATVTLSQQDLKDIRDLLVTQLDKENYNTDSIWGWEESLQYLGDKIWRLSWAIEWLKKHDTEVSVEFYDSY